MSPDFDGQETTVSQGYWFAAWEEAYIFDPTGELSGYDWIWYEYPFEGETKTAMCRIKEMEEWVVSAIDALYPDMDDIDDGRGRHKLDEHAINGEDEVLFAEEAERNNKYIFVPYTGSSYDYADEVVFGDKDGVDPEDPENYPYGCGPLPLGRICDFNVENSLITDPAEETRIDSFFRRFKIKTVEHCSEGMELTDPIYVDFKVCGHGLDDVGAKGATVEMQLVSYTAIGEGEDYQCVYVSKKMYALVGGDPAECVYLPDEKTADDVEYIRGALPTIQIFGKNVWDTPGLEFYDFEYCEITLNEIISKYKGFSTDSGKFPGKDIGCPPVYRVAVGDATLEGEVLIIGAVASLLPDKKVKMQADKILTAGKVCFVDAEWVSNNSEAATNLQEALAEINELYVPVNAGEVGFIDDASNLYVIELFKVDLNIDSNNDLKIDGADNNIEDKSGFLFWINNDTDFKNDDENDPYATIDSDNIEIDGITDLEDMATITITIPVDNLPSNSKYYLKFDSLSGSPSIRMFEKKGTGNSYISNISVANSLNDNEAWKLSDESTIIDGSKREIDISGFSDSAKKEFIFEGVSKGEGYLSLILEVDNNEVARDAVRIKLSDILAENPELYSIASFRQPYAGFIQDNRFPYDFDSFTLFVHGYNVTEEAASQEWFPTIFKRLYWAGHEGHFIGLIWEGDEGPGIAYNNNVFNAMSIDNLVSLFIKNIKPKSKRVDIMAHSLGNMVVSQAIKHDNIKFGDINNYILCEAAVAANSYDHDIDRWDYVWNGNDSFVNTGERLINGTWSLLFMDYIPGTPWTIEDDDAWWAYLEMRPRDKYFLKNNFFEEKLHKSINTYAPTEDMVISGIIWGNNEKLKPVLNLYNNYASDGNLYPPWGYEWAELAYRYPGRSRPAGSIEVPNMTENHNAEPWGINSHSAMRERSIQDVWLFFANLVDRNYLKGTTQLNN